MAAGSQHGISQHRIVSKPSAQPAAGVSHLSSHHRWHRHQRRSGGGGGYRRIIFGVASAA